MKVLYSILFSVMMVVSGQTLLKYGLIQTPLALDSSLINIFINPFVLGGLVLIGLSSVIWLSVLSKADISYAYPMFGLGYVIVALLSLFFFNEEITLLRWVGIFVICSGVFLMSGDKEGGSAS